MASGFREQPVLSFSVVIPARHAAGTIRDCIASVQRQSHTDHEIIIVDYGSEDDTAATVASIPDPRVRLLFTGDSRETACNAGIAAASGRYVAFLDTHSLWLPRYLELAAQALESASNAGFAYTDAYRLDARSGRLCAETEMEHLGVRSERLAGREEFLAALAHTNFIWPGTVVPKEVFGAVGGFDEADREAGDWDLWLRILRAGYSAARIPGVQGVIRVASSEPGIRRWSVPRARRPAPPDAVPTHAPDPAVASLLQELGISCPGFSGDELAQARTPTREETLKSWRRDRGRYSRSAWLTQRSLWAVAAFRFGQYVAALRPQARWMLAPVHHALTLLVRVTTNIEIAGRATIGPGLRIHHAGPIIINPGSVVGRDCTLNVGVIIGNRDSPAAPVIGDRVTIAAGSFVLGGITIGDNVVVGAMSLVLADVPAGAVVAGIPARVIRERPGLAEAQ